MHKNDYKPKGGKLAAGIGTCIFSKRINLPPIILFVMAPKEEENSEFYSFLPRMQVTGPMLPISQGGCGGGGQGHTSARGRAARPTFRELKHKAQKRSTLRLPLRGCSVGRPGRQSNDARRVWSNDACSTCMAWKESGTAHQCKALGWAHAGNWKKPGLRLKTKPEGRRQKPESPLFASGVKGWI